MEFVFGRITVAIGVFILYSIGVIDVFSFLWPEMGIPFISTNAFFYPQKG